MATTIINPGTNSSNTNGLGFVIGAIILVLLAVAFFIYALPFISSLSASKGVEVNIPKSIDVNVQQSK